MLSDSDRHALDALESRLRDEEPQLARSLEEFHRLNWFEARSVISVFAFLPALVVVVALLIHIIVVALTGLSPMQF